MARLFCEGDSSEDSIEGAIWDVTHKQCVCGSFSAGKEEQWKVAASESASESISILMQACNWLAVPCSTRMHLSGWQTQSQEIEIAPSYLSVCGAMWCPVHAAASQAGVQNGITAPNPIHSVSHHSWAAQKSRYKSLVVAKVSRNTGAWLSS